MERSYRQLLGKVQFTEEEVDVVMKSTMTLLRRHNVDGKLCPRCRNDDPEACRVTRLDGLGFIVEVRCDACGMPATTICRRSDSAYEPVDDPSTLRPGDHVTWHRPYLIWHHAVVTLNDPASQEITVLEYTLSGDGPYAAIVETSLSYDKSVFFNAITAV